MTKNMPEGFFLWVVFLRTLSQKAAQGERKKRNRSQNTHTHTHTHERTETKSDRNRKRNHFHTLATIPENLEIECQPWRYPVNTNEHERVNARVPH